MKALQFSSYGSRNVLEVREDAPKPALSQGQVLVKNHAASINAFDLKLREGFMQKILPLKLPITIGGDFSGTIVEIGDGVSQFKTGDEVYGSANVANGGSGSMAQYVAANAANIALKPKSLNFEQAAAIPLVGVSAMQALVEHMRLQNGQHILIHGGAGGVGSIAIQLAKSIGAYVITTVNKEDEVFVKSLGANKVINYKTEKFEEQLNGLDAVFDTVGGETTKKSFMVLKKGGILVSMVGQPDPALAKQYAVIAIGQKSKTDTAHLDRLTQLADTGKINAQIDRIFPLDQGREAFKYQEEIHPRGKVVVKI